MASKKQILYPVVFMLVLTILYTFVLAFINESSRDIIKEQEELRIKRSVLYVLNLPVTEDDTEVTALYNEKIEKSVIAERTIYIYKEGGVVSGYAFPFTGTGLWGSISGYISVSPDFTELLGIDFVSHSETPGLGGRIDEAWFKEQFRNLSVNNEKTAIFKPAEGGNLDAVTGATLTSDSVRNIVNDFVSEILDFAKEANL